MSFVTQIFQGGQFYRIDIRTQSSDYARSEDRGILNGSLIPGDIVSVNGLQKRYIRAVGRAGQRSIGVENAALVRVRA
jgi:hypothetical protein